MKLTAVELSAVTQTMIDFLQDHYRRHTDPAALSAITDIQQVGYNTSALGLGGFS